MVTSKYISLMDRWPTAIREKVSGTLWIQMAFEELEKWKIERLVMKW